MKRNYNIVLLFCGCLWLLLSSCEKLLDPDLSSSKLSIIIPSDSLKSTSLAQTFWWDKVDGASQYDLRIVSPGFDQPDSLLFDTILTGNKVVLNLKANTNYQWRLVAKNGYSNTSAITRSMFIGFSNDLSKQAITGMTPSTGDSVSIDSQGNVVLKWSSIGIALRYVLKVDTISGTKNIVAHDTIYQKDFIGSSVITREVTALKKGGYYKWSLQAFNDMPSNTTVMTSPLPTFKVKVK
jgi:uncharacterized protein YegP (UPF0339 family)